MDTNMDYADANASTDDVCLWLEKIHRAIWLIAWLLGGLIFVLVRG